MTADKVWIVDDDRSIRWVLEKALMQEGLEATAFEDAQTLLNKLGKEKPHAIVTDIRMPGIDGLTLLAKIRLEHPDVPVIVMTAHSDLDSAVSSYQGGAFEYLPKPFDVDDACAFFIPRRSETVMFLVPSLPDETFEGCNPISSDLTSIHSPCEESSS